MKLLKEADIVTTNSILEVKDLMLYRVMFISSMFGVPVILYNLYFAYGLEMNIIGFFNLILFIPIIVILLFFRKINYKVKAYTLIYTVVLMSLYNFWIAGYAGAAYMLLLCASTFAAAFLEQREALINIFICVLVSILASIMFISGTWEYSNDFYKLISDTTSWAMSVATYTFLAFMFLFAYNIIQSKLIQKIDVEHKQNEILEDANARYRDLLELQKLHQMELIDAKIKAEESNRLKTEFLHNMSHEVRTPLNGILGFSKLLKKEGLTDDKKKQFADIVIQSGEKLQRVIDDILEISFLETKQISLEIKKFKVFDFLQDLFLVFNISNGIKPDIIIKSTDPDLTLETDQHKLHKVMSNLIENAIKFTESGYVEFGCCEAKPGFACFYVKDTGIGISPENLEKIFNRFSQEHDNISAKYGGLGLGLCIARENSLLLGGNIRVESEKNVGTTFFVEIPINPEVIKEDELILHVG